MSAPGGGSGRTVLITGGAGSMGSELAVRLAAAGHRIRAFDLDRCDWSALDALERVECIRGDILDREQVEAAAQGADVVIHLAAILPPASERRRDVTMAVNVEGTAVLIDAMHRKCPNARLVFSSSVSVYGDTTSLSPPVGVDTRLHAEDLYAESKIEGERLVGASGLSATVLRVSGVAVPAFLAPPEVWPFLADQRMEFVCRSDVVEALFQCVGREGLGGKTLNIAGGLTWRMLGEDYVARLNEVFGLPAAEAVYQEEPGYFDWYDTVESQALLDYQRTSFAAFLQALQRAIDAEFELT